MSFILCFKEVLLEQAYDQYHNKGGKERAKKYSQANKEEVKKKERLKYWFMPESDKKVIRKRSLKRYYRIRNKEDMQDE